MSVGNNVDSKLDKFYDVINTEIKNHAPVRSMPIRMFAEWYDLILRELVSKTMEAHKLYSKSHNYSDRMGFRDLRAQVIRLSRIKYGEYLLKLKNDLTNNSNRFWSYLNKKKKNSDIPNTMNYNRINATDDIVISDFLSITFSLPLLA